MAKSAKRMPMPAMNPNWLKPLKLHAMSTSRAPAVVRALTAIAWPVLVKVTSAALTASRPAPRSSV